MKIFFLIKTIPILVLGLCGQITLENVLHRHSQVAILNAANESYNEQEKPVYSTRLLPMNVVSPGCQTYQLNIYATYTNGQTLLVHTAVIQSGSGCADGSKVLNSTTYSKKSGPEYIVRDEQLNGPIEDFIAEHDDIYQDIVKEKERLMGIQ